MQFDIEKILDVGELHAIAEKVRSDKLEDLTDKEKIIIMTLVLRAMYK